LKAVGLPSRYGYSSKPAPITSSAPGQASTVRFAAMMGGVVAAIKI